MFGQNTLQSMGCGHRCGARPDLRLETEPGRHPAPDSGRDTVREHAPGRWAPELRVSPHGNLVYGANRLNDTIVVFSIGDDGRLTQVSNASTLGDYPRIFTIDPSGRFMAVCNQFADNVTTFSVNPGNGKLKFTGNYTPVGSPSGMVFLI